MKKKRTNLWATKKKEKQVKENRFGL